MKPTAEDGASRSLATFVLPQIATNVLDEAARSNERRFAISLVSALTIFAVLIAGYHPFAEDGGLYMAGIKRLLDPQLYPNGTAFVTAPTRYSLFAPLVSSIVQVTHIGLLPILLALHLASVWATLFGAWIIASRCSDTREAGAGAVTLLACWFGLPVAGTALSIMDPYLTARSFSTPCMVFALVGVLNITSQLPQKATRRNGLLLLTSSIALAIAIHPLMGAYALGASLILMCLRASTLRVAVFGTFALCGMSVLLAAMMQAVAPPESAEYVRVALTRSYWFVFEWRWYELIGLVAPVAILSWCGWSKTPNQFGDSLSKLAQMSVWGASTAIVVAVIFARTNTSTHLVARMQPLRFFQIVYVVLVLVLGAILGERVLKRNPWRWAAFLIVLGSTMLTVARVGYADSNHLELPGTSSSNLWVQAFVWIRQNTPKDRLFALDADYVNAIGEDAQCFRAISERSVLADYSKDGGEASIAPALSGEWLREQQAQAVLTSKGQIAIDAEHVAELARLGVSWVIVDAAAAMKFDCPYRNSAVAVCPIHQASLGAFSPEHPVPSQ